ncbi:hypothetical protein N7462_010497 [Penicillium macrosclerotiorum]|uniref:uncharacterized protein n=1 Tax=Penicillium macrosclerotiorum TaxID=303699 RepID=UPI002547762A|nr:uncharacterized protein N7462_010497 [Penicillium macrosclerotiorum]KAJ5669427.1 hypothetical protein N7462_010497 [Penicillium macrosclerotiorum]
MGIPNKEKNETVPFATIFEAAARGRIETVRTHLENGVDPNNGDAQGRTPLHFACRGGHWDVARLLLEKGACATEDGSGLFPIYEAVRGGHLEIARLLIECKQGKAHTWTSRGGWLITSAFHRRDLPMIQFLLNSGAQANCTDHLDQTALHKAASSGDLEMCKLVLEHEKHHPPKGWILRDPPSMRRKNSRGDLPIGLAMNNGHFEIVELFLKSGQVSPKALNGHKRPLFHDAVKDGNLGMTQLFLDHGVPVDLKGWDNRRALHIAAYEGDIKMTRLLLEYGASVRTKCGSYCTPEERSRNSEVTMILRNHPDSKASKKQAKQKTNLKVSSSTADPPPEYSK